MELRNLLRAALIPLGASLVMRGLQDLRDEADELADLVAARRAYLSGEGPLPEVDEDQGDEQPDEADEGPQPKIFRAGARSSTAAVERFPVRPRHLVAGVAGFGLGWLAVAAVRRRAQVAATVAAAMAARSAALVTMPPAPGSPADLDARLAATAEAGAAELAKQRDDDDLSPYVDRIAAADREYVSPARPADPYACTSCAYVPKVDRSPAARAVDLSLHRNRAHLSGVR